MVPRRRSVWLVALVGVLIVAGVAGYRLLAPLPPLETSFWYWHRPFGLSQDEAARLKAVGIRQIFVRAGTFALKEGKIRLVLPQTWESRGEGPDIHLVFNFDYDIVRRFARLSEEEMAEAVCPAIEAERLRAARSGFRAVGIQLDFDCPTARLGKYSRFLKAVRAKLPDSRLQFSITALPTWFTDKGVQSVCESVDFIVPQYYEAETPFHLHDFKTVSGLERVSRGMKAAARYGTPFYVGIPAYGHTLLYDDRGRLIGPYRDLDAQDAARHPLFRLRRAFPADRKGRPAAPQSYIGEDILDFEAIAPAADGRGKGYRLVYDVPSAEMMARHLTLIRRERPSGCRGIILFRYPEPEELMALPLASVEAVLRGDPLKPRLRIRPDIESVPWELIESRKAADGVPVDLTLTVTNSGNAGPFFGPEAVTLTLRFDRPGLDSIDLRDFDAVETYYSGQPGQESFAVNAAMKASLRRADVLLLRKFYLAPGHRARVGPIRICSGGPVKVWGRWSAAGPGGFHVEEGVIEAVLLTGREGEER